MISAHGLSVSYHGRTVLRDVTLTAKRGRVLAIVGPSGCGKSSFLAALNQLVQVIPGASAHGRIEFDGRNVNDAFSSPAELRRHVGMIFQKPNPFATSIRRNIELALREHGVRRREELRDITQQVLRDVGLWDETHDRLEQPALELSGGQQQRLCIARALALRPQVLLMDEPCSALDPVSTAKIEELIRTMRGDYTIIIVTHNLAQAKRLSDELAIFWSRDGVGEMIEHGPTSELFTKPNSEITDAYLSGRSG